MMMVAGFGFRRGATVSSLAEALHLTGHAEAIDALATLDDKIGATFKRFAADRPLVAVTAAEAEAMTTTTQSQASLDARNIASVAEAVALAAAGPGGRLIGPRVVSGDRMATCAIAIGEQT